MEYTTPAMIRSASDGKETTLDATRLPEVCAAASRAIDRLCTGVPGESDNYLLLESVTNQILKGTVDANGGLLCYPRKPRVVSVSSLSWRWSPRDLWETVEPDLVTMDGYTVRAWTTIPDRGDSQVRISFSGGLAAEQKDLPADVVDFATMLAIRILKEERGGMSDVVGIDQMGVLLYTKSFPERLMRSLDPYVRKLRW